MLINFISRRVYFDSVAFDVFVDIHNTGTGNGALHVFDKLLARQGAPVFVQKPAIKQLNGGKTILFECKICANPKPTLVWYRDVVQLSEGGRCSGSR